MTKLESKMDFYETVTRHISETIAKVQENVAQVHGNQEKLTGIVDSITRLGVWSQQRKHND